MLEGLGLKSIVEGSKEGTLNEVKEKVTEKSKDVSNKKEVIEENEKEIKEIKTINMDKEGIEHPPGSGVFYERQTIEVNEQEYEGVFPNFDKHSITAVQLPEEMYTQSDSVQFRECTKELNQQIKDNPKLSENFTDRQLAQINSGRTPEGYTWHHSEKTGQLELVPTKIHNECRHTGGRYIWGGGTENR